MVVADQQGINISRDEIHPALQPHQQDAVVWAVQGGRRALFESFGLGKTIQQIEILRLITKHEGGQALIVAPLEVRHEFVRDGQKLLDVEIEYVRTMDEIRATDTPILITNYERVRDGDIDPAYFVAASLDEASILRGYGTKTYQTFLAKFAHTRFRFVATATPSPNKYKELIHYAGYLGVMDTGQALTRFFKRDSTKANNLTIYPHKEQEFWLWLSTWALFITRPSDLGYDDAGYDLPPLQVHYHEVSVDHNTAGQDQDGQVKMFRDAATGLKDAAREKRDSIPARVAKMREILDGDPGEHYIIWHTLEAERAAIKKAVPDAKPIYGSQDEEERAANAIDFADGRIQYLATKPEISGSGCNFQRHCRKAVFLGIDYKFNDLIQAIHRIYRYLQTGQVEIHIIHTESEQAILDALKAKWVQHDKLVSQMTEIVRRHGLASTDVKAKLSRSIVDGRHEQNGAKWTAVLSDNVFEVERMDTNSVNLIHTSIPFSNHYEYTPTYNDFGHNRDNDRFFEQMDYLTPQLMRVLKPGRVAAIHVKDRILFGNATGTGMPTVDPFSDLTTAHMIKHGFQFFGRITVVTDVVRENNQTYRLGWTEQTKDGTKMGVGCPEYILLFRKLPTDTSRAYADEPVVKTKTEYTRAQWQIDAHAFWRSSGDRLLEGDELENVAVSDLQAVYRQYSRGGVYNYREHVELAKTLEVKNKLPASFMVVAPGSWHPDVWDNINRMRTLNGEQARKELEMHVCPLQFDIVERIINRFSNPGELVLDPFGGLMTVPYMAVKLGRRGYGIELNEQSYKDGVSYLRMIEDEVNHPTLFDLEEVTA
jgi:DNA modification methylase